MSIRTRIGTWISGPGCCLHATSDLPLTYHSRSSTGAHSSTGWIAPVCKFLIEDLECANQRSRPTYADIVRVILLISGSSSAVFVSECNLEFVDKCNTENPNLARGSDSSSKRGELGLPEMGWVVGQREADKEENQPLTAAAVPKDDYNIAYFIFFLLGAGFLLPWNSFISAVDYFDVLYPHSHVDRVFSLAYMIPSLLFLLALTFYCQHYPSRLRVNLGLLIFLAVFVFVPVMDEVWITGNKGTKTTHVLTVAAASMLGVCDALVQGSLVGSVGELPERYMQALFAGTAASGVLASVLRIITKASMTHSSRGLRVSADIYFIVTAIILLACIVSYNMMYKLPIMLHYNSKKIGAMQSTFSSNNGPHDVSELGLKTDTTEISLVTTVDSELTNFAKPVSYWHVWGQIQWLAISMATLYLVTLSIFPGYITEDVHSPVLGDWYPVLLIMTYNVADLTGKILTSVYMVENQSLMVRGCFARLVFFPLFYSVLHGPAVFRTEAPVFLLTFLLGLSNGYWTSVMMIVAPKNVSILESETAGIIMTLFLVIGLAAGSLLGWAWII